MVCLLPMPWAPCTRLCRPLIFFYDKPHVCSTTHYRATIFGPGFSMHRPKMCLPKASDQVSMYKQHICAFSHVVEAIQVPLYERAIS